VDTADNESGYSETATVIPYSSVNTNSLSFDGVDDYVEISNTPNWFSGNEFTWSLWVKLNDVNLDQLFIKHGTAYGGSGNGIYLNYFANRIMLTSPNNSGEGVQSPEHIINLEEWTHIAISVELNQETSLYVNGENVSISAYNGILTSIISPSGPMYIGEDIYHDNQNLNGVIDEVSLWSQALSESEIQSYMTTSPTGNESGLVGYWRFDENSGTKVHDRPVITRLKWPGQPTARLT
jgi:hypothetical protein